MQHVASVQNKREPEMQEEGGMPDHNFEFQPEFHDMNGHVFLRSGGHSVSVIDVVFDYEGSLVVKAGIARSVGRASRAALTVRFFEDAMV